ncbi:MAG: RNA polymerase C-22 sterol desaturase [Cyphobasidiales sp. Tagirdzhanova-0007]|nr:MAG: RNA polymerase C-22 sterol desaturase [Cyphobasidiales sp. Tagirdzhanova-0007]
MASQSVQVGAPQSSTFSHSYNFASLYPGSIAASVSGPGWTTSILVVVVSLLVLEQSVYRHKKAHLPGAKWTIPIIGKFADSLKPSMSAYHQTWAYPLTATSVFNIFIVMAADNTLTRKILNSPNHTEPCLVSAAKSVLIPENWVFLGGREHAEYRKGLNVLFTRRALSIYLKVQEGIYKRYFENWLKNTENGYKPHMSECRNLNMETSLRVFCGNYLSAEACQIMSDQYSLITGALQLVNFPLALPGTKVYKAIQARKVAMKYFMFCSAESKKHMAGGAEPVCLLDEWVREMIAFDAYNQAKANGDVLPSKSTVTREYSDYEIAMVLLSFLFASQDAMTSGLIFAFQHIADYPAVFAKIRAEQLEVRQGDVDAPLTLELMDQMPYLRAFIKETLRLKPPVLMVPYMAKKAFPISENYTCPKGSIVIPSFWNSLHDPSVYTDPDELIPERWLAGGQAEHSNPQNYLVFGSGPHKCVAYDYAVMHLGAVIGTAKSKRAIIPTIYPQDDCLLQFRKADLTSAA